METNTTHTEHKELVVENIDVQGNKVVINSGEVVIEFLQEAGESYMNLNFNEEQYSEHQVKELGEDILKYLEEFVRDVK